MKRIAMYALIGAVSFGTAVSCSSKDKPTATSKAAATTTSKNVTTTTKKPGPVAPLTGLPADAATAKRCAVSVKIGNTKDARPQFGLDATDVVFEEVVDGGLTRLVAVFNSKAPTKVGTIRSTRPTDKTIVQPLGGVFAYSGGDAVELAAIEGISARRLDETAAGQMMFRDPSGTPPNNLYANVAKMYDACEVGAPTPLFNYRKAGDGARGVSVKSMTVNFVSGMAATWEWDVKSKTWLRSRFGAPDITANNYRVNAKNVVVLYVKYRPSDTIPDAAGDFSGKGAAEVYSGGKVIKGYWERPDQNKPATLTSNSGKPMVLTPGNTWVEMPDTGYHTTIVTR